MYVLITVHYTNPDVTHMHAVTELHPPLRQQGNTTTESNTTLMTLKL